MDNIFEVANDVLLSDLQKISPALLIIFTRVVLYCSEHNLPLKITSIISDREHIKNQTAVHKTGRGLDISLKGFGDLHKVRLPYLLNKWYSDIAAISKSDGVKRAAIVHDVGYGEHLHIQVKPNANWHLFNNLKE